MGQGQRGWAHSGFFFEANEACSHVSALVRLGLEATACCASTDSPVVDDPLRQRATQPWSRGPSGREVNWPDRSSDTHVRLTLCSWTQLPNERLQVLNSNSTLTPRGAVRWLQRWAEQGREVWQMDSRMHTGHKLLAPGTAHWNCRGGPCLPPKYAP